MARIVGVDIPNDKPVGTALTYIYGIGRYTAKLICEGAKVDSTIRVKDLTDEQLGAVRNESVITKPKVIFVEKSL